jgi:hypothetical protein
MKSKDYFPQKKKKLKWLLVVIFALAADLAAHTAQQKNKSTFMGPHTSVSRLPL